jgi:hypothetical protein
VLVWRVSTSAGLRVSTRAGLACQYTC